MFDFDIFSKWPCVQACENLQSLQSLPLGLHRLPKRSSQICKDNGLTECKNPAVEAPTWIRMQVSFSCMNMDVSKNMGKPPNHPFVHRVFHYFHHPFWGVKSHPYFLVQHPPFNPGCFFTLGPLIRPNQWWGRVHGFKIVGTSFRIFSVCLVKYIPFISYIPKKKNLLNQCLH